MKRTIQHSKCRTCALRYLTSFLSVMLITAIVTILIFLISPQAESKQSYPPGIMTSKEVKPGMTGYGLSVFNGTTVERFPVVVVGKIRSGIGESDMILVKIQGGYPVQHKTGVIAGMSGSPVYINGRLIGAIGYGWSFSLEPIGGVTPIEEMLRNLPKNTKSYQPKRNVTKEFRPEEPLSIDGKNYERVLVKSIPSKTKGKLPDGTMTLTPLNGILQVQGFSQSTIKLMKEKFEPYGIIPMAIPGGAKSRIGVPCNISPGSPIGISLVEGDLYLGGTGTVTYKNGNTFLAFGHPFLQLGAIDLPLNGAYIEGIMPGIDRPFKFASSLGIVGTLKEDRLFAISGIIGEKPPMIPMTIEVNDKDRNWRKKFNLRVANHRCLTPMALAAVGVESVASSSTSMCPKSASIHYSIKLKGYKPIEFDELVAGEEIQGEIADQLTSYMKDLSPSDIDPVVFENVNIKIDIHPECRSAMITDVSTQFSQAKIGERLEVIVRMKKRNGKYFTKTVPLELPADVPKGPMKIAVGSGKSINSIKRKNQIAIISPETTWQVVDHIRKKERSNELVIYAAVPRKTVAFAGARLPELPPSKVAMFESSPHSNVGVIADGCETRVKLPFCIEGGDLIQVRINEESPIVSGSKAADKTDIENAAPEKMTAKYFSKESRAKRALALKNLNIDAEKLAVPKDSKTEKSDKKEDKKVLPTGSYVGSLSEIPDYFLGIFQGTSVNDGNVILGHKLETIYESDQTYVFAMCRDSSGKIYAAESPSGFIVEVGSDKNRNIIAKTGEVFIPSMAVDCSGAIYIGTGPSGRIYKKEPGKKIKLLCTLPADIIWDLKIEPQGTILAAAGRPGAIYRINPDGHYKAIFEAPAAYVTSMAFGLDGIIFAGCANEGTIYKICPDGKYESYFKTLGSSIDSMLYDDGSLWAASDELLYRISPTLQPKVYIFPENSVNGILKDSNGDILVSTFNLGRIYKISKIGIENQFEADINQVFCTLPLSNGEVLISTGNPGKIAKLTPGYIQRGVYLSKVFDNVKVAEYGNIQWLCDQPKGSCIEIQTRTGNTVTPDATWSEWSPSYTTKEGIKIMSPPGRYLQIKATLLSGLSDVSPKLYDIKYYYRHKNMAPVMGFETPAGGEKWAGSAEIKWKSYAANVQTLAFTLCSSDDNGKTWKPIEENIPASMKEQNIAGSDEKEEKLQSDKYKWNTKKVKDGEYLIKLIGFDITDAANPQLQGETISKPIIICNKEPEITIVKNEAEECRAVITGFVKTGQVVNVKQVLYRTDDKEWKLAYPVDGIFDCSREKFAIYLNKPYPATVKLQVKATDEAGNSKECKKEIILKKDDKKEESKKNNDKDKKDSKKE